MRIARGVLIVMIGILLEWLLPANLTYVGVAVSAVGFVLQALGYNEYRGTVGDIWSWLAALGYFAGALIGFVQAYAWYLFFSQPSPFLDPLFNIAVDYFGESLWFYVAIPALIDFKIFLDFTHPDDRILLYIGLARAVSLIFALYWIVLIGWGAHFYYLYKRLPGSPSVLDILLGR